ncbi:hypothetical protein Taro_054431 [Colocasia esculenta]|uniref:Uncharacterized protein n=1 Tax=Colocasia esculenta TaxID=4460 RepID=A0A843XQG7_COLES|nr:hypothetical protein [Colocasia esculenta]
MFSYLLPCTIPPSSSAALLLDLLLIQLFLDQRGSFNFVIRSFSKWRNCVGGGFGAIEDGGEDCLTAKAGFFGLWRLVDVEELVRPGVMSEQEAQDQTGVPLPPLPPPVDYEALMQGLVHVMQTQAQTIAALQAQAPAHEAGFGGVSLMEKFRRMTPPFFKGESDPILAESWLRETEKIFRAIRCAEEERVKIGLRRL